MGGGGVRNRRPVHTAYACAGRRKIMGTQSSTFYGAFTCYAWSNTNRTYYIDYPGRASGCNNGQF